ncbi:MAG: transposase, partial [Myxococcales bacterium]|nr:transposase [Myxococcales bacterium]
MRTRQAKIYERDGVMLSPSTMVGWIAAVAWLLEPLYRAINERVLRAWVVQSDDTGLTVLDRREAGGSRRGHIWANIGDADRRAPRSAAPPATARPRPRARRTGRSTASPVGARASVGARRSSPTSRTSPRSRLRPS